MWLIEPTKQGHYWVATKARPACMVVWYFPHDDGLTVLGGPGEGIIYTQAIRGGIFKKIYPEALFWPVERPDNPMKNEAKRELVSSKAKLALGPNFEIMCSCHKDAVPLLTKKMADEHLDL